MQATYPHGYCDTLQVFICHGATLRRAIRYSEVGQPEVSSDAIDIGEVLRANAHRRRWPVSVATFRLLI